LKDVGAGGAFFAPSVPNRVLVKFVSVFSIDPLDFMSDNYALRCTETINVRMVMNSELARSICDLFLVLF
jgi:hypothetical protein